MSFNPLLFGEKYRIPTNRLQSHGYGVGFYHVVVCTKDRRCYLGHIEHEQMFYSAIGQFAKGCIEGLSTYYPYLEVLCFQIMPNHIHLLLYLSDAAPNNAIPSIPSLKTVSLKMASLKITRSLRIPPPQTAPHHKMLLLIPFPLSGVVVYPLSFRV